MNNIFVVVKESHIGKILFDENNRNKIIITLLLDKPDIKFKKILKNLADKYSESIFLYIHKKRFLCSELFKKNNLKCPCLSLHFNGDLVCIEIKKTPEEIYDIIINKIENINKQIEEIKIQKEKENKIQELHYNAYKKMDDKKNEFKLKLLNQIKHIKKKNKI